MRTPWTIRSDDVWHKTNRLAGRLFKISAALAILGAIMPSHAIIPVILPAVASAVIAIVYSYVEYRKGGPSGKEG